jgi:Flp pilus assembly pilin Flp
MDFMYSFWARLTVVAGELRDREEGQTFAEYAIIVATIVVGVVAAVTTLRTAVIGALTTAAGQI